MLNRLCFCRMAVSRCNFTACISYNSVYRTGRKCLHDWRHGAPGKYLSVSKRLISEPKSWPRKHVAYRSISTSSTERTEVSTPASSCIDTDLTPEELEHIKSLFPLPAHTMNNLQSIKDGNVFKLYFTYDTPKELRSKNVIIWKCLCTMSWPERIQITRTGSTKHEAQSKIAIQVLHWLLTSGYINENGKALHDMDSVNKLIEHLNPPFKLTLGSECSQTISRLLDLYEADVAKIFSEASDDATNRKYNSEAQKCQSSSELLEEDELTSDEMENDDLSASEDEELMQNIFMDPITGRLLESIDFTATDDHKESLLEDLQNFRNNSDVRMPIDEHFSQLQQYLTGVEGGALVIEGATGCGKSTRAPLWGGLYNTERNTRIVVSEPRKVAAISLARSVAKDIGQEVGENVGYCVRLQSCPPKRLLNSLLYCTSGVLLRRLLNNPGLLGCTHVFVDEAHERDINTDILLLLLKKAMTLNSELKVIIMSATINTEIFSRYFNDCPIFKIPGRYFPVTSYHLEDLSSNLLNNIRLPIAEENSERHNAKPHVDPYEIANVVRAIDFNLPEGAILVFLPGWLDIKKTMHALNECYGNSSTIVIIPIHSRLSNEDQKEIFNPPTKGVRKVILATNIAESSVTICDVVYVVDTGAFKQFVMKGRNGVSSLQTDWISRSSMQQRSGRAGRIMPGVAFRLYSSRRAASFEEYTAPEIQRVPLEKTVLDCKLYSAKEKAVDLLSQLPEPPKPNAIRLAIEELTNMGALDENEELTGLGRMISQFTLHPRLSKTLVHAVIFRTVTPILDIVAYIANNFDVFVDSMDRKPVIRTLKRQYNPVSDHLAIHSLVEDFFKHRKNGNGQDFCDENKVRADRMLTLRALRRIYIKHLQQVGLINEAHTDRYGNAVDSLDAMANFDEVTKAVLFSGVAALVKDWSTVKSTGRLTKSSTLIADCGSTAYIPADSCNSGASNTMLPRLLAVTDSKPIIADKVKVVCAGQTSLVSPLTVALMAEGELRLETSNEVCEKTGEPLVIVKVINHNVDVQCTKSDADLILELRSVLKSTLDYYIEHGGISQNNSIVDGFVKNALKCLAKVLDETRHIYEYTPETRKEDSILPVYRIH